jgi:predicted nucleic acid-binding protein
MEFADVASRKFGQPWHRIIDLLRSVRALCRVQDLTIDVHERALWIAARYRLGIYDAAIVGAALAA